MSETGTERTLYVGADRCESGWVAAAYTTEGFDHAAVFEETGELWAHVEESAVRVLVGIPIGLRESGESPRPPDELARRLLGARAGDVFDPPVREATLKQRYPTANRVHERKTGQRLSRAAYEAATAIAEVDSLLGAIPEARETFREANAELCFRAFAGEPLTEPKESAAGYAERLRTLAEFDPEAPVDVVATAEATAGRAVRVHDVLDATALALTARPGPGELRTLPPTPETDAEGRPMGTHYRSPSPLGP